MFVRIQGTMDGQSEVKYTCKLRNLNSDTDNFK